MPLTSLPEMLQWHQQLGWGMEQPFGHQKEQHRVLHMKRYQEKALPFPQEKDLCSHGFQIPITMNAKSRSLARFSFYPKMAHLCIQKIGVSCQMLMINEYCIVLVHILELSNLLIPKDLSFTDLHVLKGAYNKKCLFCHRMRNSVSSTVERVLDWEWVNLGFDSGSTRHVI